MAYTKLNNVNDIPTSKTQLTKEWMSEYVLEKGNAEQIATCIKYLEDDTMFVDGVNNFTGEKIRKVNVSAMRNWFCDQFFSNLNEKKAKKENGKKKTIEERLKEALEKKAGK